MSTNIGETKSLAAAGVIFAPAAFLNTPVSNLELICNGCGAANAKFDFVPDRIYGTYVGHACHIHDFMYENGHTEEDREEADRVMLNNLLRLCKRDADKKWYKPLSLMRKRCRVYYRMVRSYGADAFFVGKN